MTERALAVPVERPRALRSSAAGARSLATLAAGSKTFALAARLLPEPARTDTAVLYAFCRRVDDAIDLCPRAGQGAALAALRSRLDSAYAGSAQPDVLWHAFAELVHARAIPRAYPEELLLGMEMDVRGARYETLDELLEYCHRVAGVVGLMLCHVFGVARPNATAQAAQLGIAMQLTNICRDVLEDWQRGRLYLPARELARAGAAGLAHELGREFPSSARAPVGRTVASLLALAERFYRSADRGLSALPIRAALAVRAASRLYAGIGSELREHCCDVTAGRAFVPTARKLRILLASTFAEGVTVPARAIRNARYAPPGRVARFPEDVLV